MIDHDLRESIYVFDMCRKMERPFNLLRKKNNKEIFLWKWYSQNKVHITLLHLLLKNMIYL